MENAFKLLYKTIEERKGSPVPNRIQIIYFQKEKIKFKEDW